MCAPQQGTFTAPDLSRRTLLRGVGAAGAALTFSTALSASPVQAAKGKLRVYVLVVDGCRPGEISADLTPNLAALRAGGLNFPRARSLPVMETIPNHVMMMTGVRPDRSGVPANTVYDRALGEVRTLDQADDLKAPTVLTALNKAGFTTGTVLSKEYLYGIFGERATYRWEPSPVIPVSGHAPDLFTTEAAISMVTDLDPNFMFVNFGDIDRMGHSDLSGMTVKLARQTALADTDVQVGRFLDTLKNTGRWQSSVVIVLADHSMDWSRPDRIVSLQPVVDADPYLSGMVEIAGNGGADLLSWTGPAAGRTEAIRRMTALALETDGVLSVHEPADLRLGPEAGDLVVYCKAGWRFTDPSVWSNPIPGNHGHPATGPIPFFIGGGHRIVPKGAASTARAYTMDVAPTVAGLFGVGAPRGGFDGKTRL